MMDLPQKILVEIIQMNAATTYRRCFVSRGFLVSKLYNLRSAIENFGGILFLKRAQKVFC